MEDKRTPSGLIVGIAQDPSRALLIIVFLSLLLLMLCSGGIAIYPYLIIAVQNEGFNFSSPISKLLVTSGLCGIVGILFSVYLCWYHHWSSAKSFSFGNVFMSVYLMEMILCFILMGIFRIDMLSISNTNGWTQLLGILFNGMLGILLCILPSFIPSFIGVAVNRIWKSSRS